MGNPVAQPASMTNANKIMNGKHIALLRIGILPALVRLFPAASMRDVRAENKRSIPSFLYEESRRVICFRCFYYEHILAGFARRGTEDTRFCALNQAV